MSTYLKRRNIPFSPPDMTEKAYLEFQKLQGFKGFQ